MKLNKLILMKKYPFIGIDDIFDQMRGKNLFSKIDLRFGYHQVRIKEEENLKINFSTRYGH